MTEGHHLFADKRAAFEKAITETQEKIIALQQHVMTLKVGLSTVV